MRDEIIFDVAKLQPETPAQLAEVRGINERVVQRFGNDLCQLINNAKNQPPVTLEDKLRSAKKTQQQEAILDILTALVRIRAEENSLNPAILATRKDLEDLMLTTDGDCQLLRGWRYSMAGKELLGLLQGQLFLAIEANKLTIFIRSAIK
jgi:ribonuclease D